MKIHTKRGAAPDNRLAIDLPATASADQIVLVARVRALDERLHARSSWSEKEIRVLLAGAVDSALRGGDVPKGAALLAEAQAAFDQALQTTNRNWYLLALVVGVILVALVGAVVVTLAEVKVGHLAEPDMILALFTFAGMGSVTSVLTRLSALDLRAEISRKFVIYSAIAKPFVAISFASVIYVILANGIVTIGHWSPQAQQATYWVAAFLCGFSERFASDILGRALPSSQA